MDIILLINITFIILFFFLKRIKECYTALYSFSLFAGIFTCLYFFYRYGTQEAASIKAEIYIYTSPILLFIDILLIFKQSRSSQGIGIATYLKSFLSTRSKSYINKIVPGILFYTLITITAYLLTLYYESIYPPQFPPNYSLTVTQFIWQYLYIIPLSLMFWYMELKKFSKTIFICSVGLYPFIIFALVMLKVY